MTAPARRTEIAAAAVILAVFYLVRIALLVVREPFFDELFTLWMARRPVGAILPALIHDSGPPLYYFVARIPDIAALRGLSLLFGSIPLVLILGRRSLGPARFHAAALLALYPPAAFYAADARSYALCGALVAAGVLFADDDRPLAAAGFFSAAAYTHYLGALLIPTLLLKGRRGALAAAAAAVIFLPGLFLAASQPAEATAWMGSGSPLGVAAVFAFTGPYAEALLRPAPLAASIASALLVLVAASKSWRFAPFVLVPAGLAAAAALAGRGVYFPLRFESVIAAPFALWIAGSLVRWSGPIRPVLLGLLLLAGGANLAIGIREHARRSPDPYLTASRLAEEAARRGETIVASGYCLLPALAAGTGEVIAFPAAQGTHPGWRSPVTSEEAVAAAAQLPRGAFVFVGERGSPEAAAIQRLRGGRIVHQSEAAMVARVAGLH